jgi:3-oxoacyl-[acyl-carrier protein] reductase
MPTALVTGASRGIGRAVALRLALDGYEVIAAARGRQDLDSLCAEIAVEGGTCRPLVMDVGDPSAVDLQLAGLDVDVLVNNAGIGILKRMTEMTAKEWHSMIDVNVNALYHVTRAVLPGMIGRGGGHVCTIGSIAGRSAFVGGSCYAGTKAFVNAWAESLLLEVREWGVKVSVVMPGAVATEFGGKTPSEADSWKLSPEDVAAAVSNVIATPPDVLVHRLEIRTLSSPPAKPPAKGNSH